MRPTAAVLAGVARLAVEGRVVEHRRGQEAQAPAPADAVSEDDFQAAVIALAKRNGWLVYHPRDSRKSEAGWPDLAMVRPGRLVLAELKTATGEPSAAQRTWLELLASVPGVEVFTWRPADWNAIAATLA